MADSSSKSGFPTRTFFTAIIVLAVAAIGVWFYYDMLPTLEANRAQAQFTTLENRAKVAERRNELARASAPRREEPADADGAGDHPSREEVENRRRELCARDTRCRESGPDDVAFRDSGRREGGRREEGGTRRTEHHCTRGALVESKRNTPEAFAVRDALGEYLSDAICGVPEDANPAPLPREVTWTYGDEIPRSGQVETSEGPMRWTPIRRR